MYNYFMLVGRIVKNPEIKELDDGRIVMNLNLAVRKPFKNSDGVYETEFYRISFWDFLIDIYKEYLKKGMAIGIKGRMQISTTTLSTGYELQYPNLIGERIMFFDSKGLEGDIEEEKGNQ